MDDDTRARTTVHVAHVRMGGTQVGFQRGGDPFSTTASHTEVQFGAAVRLVRRVWLEVTVPYVWKVLDNATLPAGGVPGHPDVPRKEMAGVGDVRVWERWRAFDPLVLSLGLQLPTGETVANPYPNEAAGHTVMQIGNGTVNPLLQASASTRAGPVEPYADAQVVVVPYANDRGFEAGDQFLMEVGAAWPLWRRRVRPRAGLAPFWRGTDRMPAVIVDDTGGWTLYAVPGVEIAPWRWLAVEGLLRLPILQHPNSLQLAEDFQLFGGIGVAMESVPW